METSINIISTADGKKKQKSMANINPNATNALLGELGQKINALSTNTYVNTVRIDKMDVSEPSPTPTPSKTEPTLEIELDDEGGGTYSYNGDGVIYGRAFKELSGTTTGVFIKIESGTFSLNVDGEFDMLTVQLYASEGSEYAAKLEEATLM